MRAIRAPHRAAPPPTCAPLSRLIVGSHAVAADQYVASIVRPAAEDVEVELRSTCGALEAAVNGSARSAPESHRADTRGRAQVDLLRGVAPTGASFDHVAAVLTALRCDHGHDHDTLSTSSLGLTVEASTRSSDEPTNASRAVHEPSKTMEARRQHEMTCGLAAGPARAERADEKALGRLLIPKSVSCALAVAGWKRTTVAQNSG